MRLLGWERVLLRRKGQGALKRVIVGKSRGLECSLGAFFECVGRSFCHSVIAIIRGSQISAAKKPYDSDDLPAFLVWEESLFIAMYWKNCYKSVVSAKSRRGDASVISCNNINNNGEDNFNRPLCPWIAPNRLAPHPRPLYWIELWADLLPRALLHH